MYVGKKKLMLILFFVEIQLKAETTDKSLQHDDTTSKDTSACLQGISTYNREPLKYHLDYGTMLECLKEYLEQKKWSTSKIHVKELKDELVRLMTSHSNDHNDEQLALNKQVKCTRAYFENEEHILAHQSRDNESNEEKKFDGDKKQDYRTEGIERVNGGEDMIKLIECQIEDIIACKRAIFKTEDKIKQCERELKAESAKSKANVKKPAKIDENEQVINIIESVEKAKIDAEKTLAEKQGELSEKELVLKKAKITLINQLKTKLKRDETQTETVAIEMVDKYVNYLQNLYHADLNQIPAKSKPVYYDKANYYITRCIGMAISSIDTRNKALCEAKRKSEIVFSKFEGTELKMKERKNIFDIIKTISTKQSVIKKLEQMQNIFWDECYVYVSLEDFNKISTEEKSRLRTIFSNHLLSYFKLALHLEAMYKEREMMKSETNVVVMNLKRVALEIQDALIDFYELNEIDKSYEVQCMVKKLPEELTRILGFVYALIGGENKEIANQETEANAVLSELEKQTECFVDLMMERYSKNKKVNATMDSNADPDIRFSAQRVSIEAHKEQVLCKSKPLCLEEMMQANNKIIADLRLLLKKRAARYSNRTQYHFEYESNAKPKANESYTENAKLVDEKYTEELRDDIVYANKIISLWSEAAKKALQHDSEGIFDEFIERIYIKQIPDLLTNIRDTYEEYFKSCDIDEHLKSCTKDLEPLLNQIKHPKQSIGFVLKNIKRLLLHTGKIVSLTKQDQLLSKRNKMLSEMYESFPGMINANKRLESIYVKIIEKRQDVLKYTTSDKQNLFVGEIQIAMNIIYKFLTDFRGYAYRVNENTEDKDLTKSVENMCALSEYLLDCNIGSDKTVRLKYNDNVNLKIAEFFGDNDSFFNEALSGLSNKMQLANAEDDRQCMEAIAKNLVTLTENDNSETAPELECEAKLLADKIFFLQPNDVQLQVEKAKEYERKLVSDRIKASLHKLEAEEEEPRSEKIHTTPVNVKKNILECKKSRPPFTVAIVIIVLIVISVVCYGAWYLVRKIVN